MDLKHCLYILRRRIWLILILSVVITGIYSVVESMEYQPVYEARCTLYIIDKNTNQDSSITYENIIVNEQLVKDYRELVKSKSVTREVISELKILDLTPQSLADKIDVSSKNDTRVLEIKVADYNPDRAKKIADKVSDIFIKKIADLMNTDNVNIIDYAEVPENPVNSNLAYSALKCLFICLPLLAGIVILIESANNTIGTIEDVEHYLKLEVLGVIPTLNIK
jgi:capsular polysaccharide biosynthesis protein